MRIARTLILTLSTVVAIALGAPPALGDERAAAAEVEISRGVELRRARRDAEALEAFERAYRLAPSGRVRAQIGLAEQALGRWVAAERSLDAALSEPQDLWIAKNRDVLAASLALVAGHLATVDVTSNVDCASLYVDGELAGPLPRTVHVAAGVITLDATAPGYVTMRRSIEVDAGVVAREVLTLVPRLSPSEGPPSRAALPFASPEPAPVAAPAGASRAWTVASFAGAGTFVGLGAAAMFARESSLKTYNEDATACPPATRSVTCSSQRAAVERWTTLAAVAFGVGGAMAVTGVVLLVTAPKPGPSRAAWLSVGLTGVALTGTF